ncbi:MAG: DNA recombination protein RmuC [Candidatus Paceibacteria bacterium]|jgi:DNA recombination protein RmuC
MEIIIIIFLVVIAGLLLWILLRPQEKQDNEASSLLLQQLNELTRNQSELKESLQEKLGESAQKMHESLKHQSTESINIIRDVTERLTKLDETNKQVVGFADQLKSLQDILKNPKQRGILGEYYLETLLKNVMPPGSYQMQYSFKDGNIVDAAVFVKDKVIPIDSKFSLDNYNRIVETNDPAEKLRLEKVFVNDLKLRITETAKYIKPSENTMEFAFMFIPHEAIYYDLLINKIGAVTSEDTENLIQRAASKHKVIIVSPTSFLAYLQTVLQGLKAMQIEDSAKDIIKRVGELGTHIGKYETYMSKLGASLGTTVNHYNTAHKELKKVDKDVMRITGESIEIDPVTLEKPQQDD